ncbi:protein of unknown function (DUF3598) [Leptolyngbyaceae cyanobacterium JSC-12]|nr:protein of unknown function (DUF3598) [Leptolyngbyaceae cyanobacterium JSC-12]
MKSQWDCLLQNLGEWHGSFTRLSPNGECIEETATVVSLQGLNHNQTMRQTIRRLTSPPDEKILEYSSLGRGVLFLDTGAFSQGSIQFGPFSEFGAELGLIETREDNSPGDRRLRLVQLYNRESQLHQLTLIREYRAGTNAPERPLLTVNDLLGTWQGEAVTVYPDWQAPKTYTTTLHIERWGDRLMQQLKIGSSETIITSSAAISGSVLTFTQGAQMVQVLLLPDGGSSTCPTQIKTGQPFFLELGWLLRPNLRQRLIRSYGDKGEWNSLTLVTENRL